MSALLPIRVSIYHFLVVDTKPTASMIADAGGFSIPQARIFLVAGVQAIVSALLAFEQTSGSDAVSKKLFKRNQIKEMRHYNAFHFETMDAAMQYGIPVYDTVFGSAQISRAVCSKISELTHIPPKKVTKVLSALTLLCVRELAIVADFAHLDADEIHLWFDQQSQFLTAQPLIIDNNPLNTVPAYPDYWHTITNYVPKAIAVQERQQDLPHYAKVIGRMAAPAPILINNNAPLPIDTTLTNQIDNEGTITQPTTIVTTGASSPDKHADNALTFATLPGVYLPSYRWLLQLAKIMDIYLSRNRLKITAEPAQAPTKPLVNFSIQDNLPAATDNDRPIEYEPASPFWKKPLFLIMVVVIGGLGILALIKYQYQQVRNIDTVETTQTDSDMPSKDRPKDIAIIRIEDSETH